MKKLIILIIGVMLSQSMLQAQQLELPRFYSDHMVYQRGEPFKIWGWDKPGQVITVSFGDVKHETKAAEDGSWEIIFPAQEAGGPHQFIIIGSTPATIKDVYFGDVWIAGGQSNMEWKLSWEVDGWEQEVANSDFPEIRFFDVPNELSIKKETQLNGGEWKIANPENTPEFSAVAWYFAKLNHIEKRVPIGIIDANWGGTPAEAWTPAEELLTVEGYENSANEMLNSEIDWEQHVELNNQLNEEKYQRVTDTTVFQKYGMHLFEADDYDWDEVILPNEQALHDFVWLRKSISLDNVENARLSFGNPGKFTVVFINGTQVYAKTWSDNPEIINIDKSILQEGENVIAIRTVEDWDNQTFIGMDNEFWFKTSSQEISLEGAWKFSNTIEPPMPEAKRYEHSPGTLYNSMIHPIVGYPIRGTIWYQGESNVGMNQYYHELFTTMIESWRSAWNDDFPFLFVQLAAWLPQHDQPTDSDWANLREAQTQTLALTNTGMAVTIDIGDADDIHPRNKKDVGYRLWQAARKVVYDDEIVHSGPMYRSHKIIENSIEITFNYAENGWENKNYNNIEGFAIAGPDSVFHWAKAEIDKNKIRVFSDQVLNPVAVRYAWADNPKVSLYNREGLPVVPFRTDEW